MMDPKEAEELAYEVIRWTGRRGVQTYSRLSPDRIRIKEYVGECEDCKGKGQVYVQDWSADGHGGMLGGMMRWLQCSTCKGTGHGEEFVLVDYARHEVLG